MIQGDQRKLKLIASATSGPGDKTNLWLYAQNGQKRNVASYPEV